MTVYSTLSTGLGVCECGEWDRGRPFRLGPLGSGGSWLWSFDTLSFLPQRLGPGALLNGARAGMNFGTVLQK